MNKHPLLLKLDKAGNPVKWVNYQEAVRLYINERVLCNLGKQTFTIRGGVNAKTQIKSQIQISSILLTRGRVCKAKYPDLYSPHLDNHALFRRDGSMCMYCGGVFPNEQLTRDHVMPLSRGGKNVWENVVTACFRCNNHKGDKTPEEWNQKPLLAVPYRPNLAEYLFLQNRRIIADQQQFLMLRFRKNSDLIRRLS